MTRASASYCTPQGGDRKYKSDIYLQVYYAIVTRFPVSTKPASLMAKRTTSGQAALRQLGEDRFIAFLRAVREDGGCLAVRLMNERLDEGVAPASCFPKGEEYGYILEVKELGPLQYRIAFGCVAGPLAGDGGEWEVRFDARGGAVEVVPGVFWRA